MTDTTMSTRRKTALAVLAAYESLDINNILALRTEDCHQVIGPESLNRDPMDNATYRVFFTAATARIQNFKLTIKDIVEDPLANKVVVYARSTADTAAGKDTYGNEYFLLLEFNEAGDKISKLVEYVDSAKTKEQVAILLG